MPAHPEEPKIVPPKRKSKSGGVTAIVEARVLQALEKKAKKDAAHEQKTFPLRRIMGAVALGVWLLFIIAEFFNWVEHVDTFGHDLTMWSPLFIGVLLLAPDAFDKLVAFVGRIKGLKVSLPAREEKPPEEH